MRYLDSRQIRWDFAGTTMRERKWYHPAVAARHTSAEVHHPTATTFFV